MGVRRRVALLAVAGALVAACAPPNGGGPDEGGPVTISMDGTYGGSFFSLPWPNAIRKKADGSLDLWGIPTNGSVPLALMINGASDVIRDFGTNAAVYLQFTGEIDAATLPTPSASASPSSPVQLVNLDDPSDRVPVVARIERADGYRTANLLSLLPYPGRSMRPSSRYAAIVTNGVRALDGTPLAPSPTLAALDDPWWLGRARSEAAWTELRAQRDAVRSSLAATPWAAADLVGFTVFTTQATHRELDAVAAAVAATPLQVPAVDVVTPCTADPAKPALLRGRLELPMYQSGPYPYESSGGDIWIGPDGRAVEQGVRDVSLEVRVPCAPPPAEGWAIQTYVGGTGSDADGSGRFGKDATATIIGAIAPLYSPGEDGDAYSESLFYNVLNPRAARTNPIQQAANNLVLLRTMEAFSVSLDLAGSTRVVGTDDAHVVITGHSQGAQTLTLVWRAHPGIDAIVSSAASSGQYNSISYRSDIRARFGQVIGDSAHLDPRNPLVQVVETLMDVDEPASFPTSGSWLNVAGLADGCLPFESSRHLAGAQRLTVVNPQYGSVFGDAALDPVVGSLPLGGNADGGTATRVSIETPGSHHSAHANTQLVGRFIDQVARGEVPVIAAQVINPGLPDSCPPRYGPIGNDL